MTTTTTKTAPGIAGLVAPDPPKARTRRPGLSLALRTLGPIALFALWWTGSARGWIRPDVLASPGDVGGAFGELWGDGQLQDALRVSLTRAGLGLSLGISAGLVLGVISGLTRLGEELVDSSVQMLRAVPFLSLVPLFIVWFGIDESSKILLIAVAVSFPTYVNVHSGVRNVDRKVVEAARTFGLSGPRLVFEVILPGALSSILAGARLALTISVIALIAAEEINATAGLGHLMNQALNYVRTDILVVCIILYAVLGLTADLLVRLVERLIMPWRRQVAVR
ncbi:sulfonate transport system permease protein [Actinocorallia herbida]|uniref:Sulfonate transport system permease protein n=1 Tax=Actinocorallia herbida TaxID=58109 RepID=A0A3N1D0F7_9ACTN|nr:ABC transporter permease subunit [Actinocorallia herbida]ROO87012.1 sulfonate transport system permease protein [Actinocorallia herbida]